MSGRRSLAGIGSAGPPGFFRPLAGRPSLIASLSFVSLRAVSRCIPGTQSSHSIGAPLIMYAAASTAGHHARSTGPSGFPGTGSRSAAIMSSMHSLTSFMTLPEKRGGPSAPLSKSIAYPVTETGDTDHPTNHPSAVRPCAMTGRALALRTIRRRAFSGGYPRWRATRSTASCHGSHVDVGARLVSSFISRSSGGGRPVDEGQGLLDHHRCVSKINFHSIEPVSAPLCEILWATWVPTPRPGPPAVDTPSGSWLEYAGPQVQDPDHHLAISQLNAAMRS